MDPDSLQPTAGSESKQSSQLRGPSQSRSVERLPREEDPDSLTPEASQAPRARPASTEPFKSPRMRPNRNLRSTSPVMQAVLVKRKFNNGVPLQSSILKSMKVGDIVWAKKTSNDKVALPAILKKKPVGIKYRNYRVQYFEDKNFTKEINSKPAYQCFPFRYFKILNENLIIFNLEHMLFVQYCLNLKEYLQENEPNSPFLQLLLWAD